VNGRFAPSPTGVLHLGNLRTALLAWLFARSAGSSFLVRVEDLDAGRVRPRFVTEQLDDLAAIGLDWDGPVWVQSQRADAYEAALARLPVYECFCTRAEIREAASAAHGPVGVYPGTCLGLSEADRAARVAEGRTPALRVRADATSVAFEDRLMGPQEGVVDDFVVRRNDGAFAYNLAVVVDDAAQGIEEVVRGADLVDSTPRQLWLARALGVAEPAYAHVPLVLGPDGRRLAKRDGDVTLRELAPGDAVAWMARSLRLGEARTAADLLDRFDPDAIPREPTTFAP
jgi:glutamyl-tRNA synthetase